MRRVLWVLLFLCACSSMQTADALCRETLRIGRGGVRSLLWHPQGTHLLVQSYVGVWVYDAALNDVAYLPHAEQIFFSGRWLVGKVAPDQWTIWDAETFEARKQVSRATFSADGRWLAGIVENQIVLFSGATLEQVASLDVPVQDTDSIVWNPDSTAFAVVESDNVQVWSAEDQPRLLYQFSSRGSMRWSPDGSWIVTEDQQTLRFWHNGIAQFAISANYTNWGFSPKGSFLSTTTGSGQITLWDIDSNSTTFATAITHIAPISTEPNFYYDVYPAQFLLWHPEERFLLHYEYALSGGVGDTSPLRIYDPRSGELLAEQSTTMYPQISPDGRYLLEMNGLHDLETLQITPLPAWPLYGAWSADSQRIAMNNFTYDQFQDVLTLFDVQRGVLHQLNGHNNDITKISFSLDGRLVVSAGSDGDLRLWEVHTGALIASRSDHATMNAPVFNRDGSLLAVRTPLEGSLRVYETATGTLRSTLYGEAGQIAEFAWQPNGTLIALFSQLQPNTFFAYGTQTFIWDAASDQLIDMLQHGTMVTDVSWSSDGSTLVSAANSAEAFVWDANTQIQLQFGSLREFPNVYWSPERYTFALSESTGSHGGSRLSIYDLETWQAPQYVDRIASSNRPYSWSADGSRILDPIHLNCNERINPSLCFVGIAELYPAQSTAVWEANYDRDATFVLPIIFRGRSTFVWSPDARTLLTLTNGTLRAWDLSSGTSAGDAPLYTRPHIESAAWSPDSRYLILDHRTHSTRIVDGATGEVLYFLIDKVSSSWSPASTYLTTYSPSEGSQLRDGRTGDVLQNLESTPIWSADERQFVLQHRGQVIFWRCDG
jgi:WD40 repeat protein